MRSSLILTGLVLLMTVTETIAGPQLPVCPSSPNCVSSQADDSHFIAPFAFDGDPVAAFARLRDILASRSDTTLVLSTGSELRAEFRTALGFVDDGLFLLDPEQGVIQCRSAARLGYWDLGKNRRRLEEIRQQFAVQRKAGQ